MLAVVPVDISKLLIEVADNLTSLIKAETMKFYLKRYVLTATVKREMNCRESFKILSIGYNTAQHVPH